MSRHRVQRLSRPLSLATAAACLLVLTACGSGDEPQASAPTAGGDGTTVDTGLLAFDPETANVKVGQSVTWVGGDNIKHVLVQGTYQVGDGGLRRKESDDGTFSLTLSRKGEKVSHTYTTPGTFTYFCTIHKGMNGTVVVS